jgi:hypothetical protein
MPVSMSRIVLITHSGTGKGRTASVRRIEPRSTSRPRLHRWTDRENTFGRPVRGLRAALSTGVGPVRSMKSSLCRPRRGSLGTTRRLAYSCPGGDLGVHREDLEATWAVFQWLAKER